MKKMLWICLALVMGHVFAETRVEEILVEGDRATGVRLACCTRADSPHFLFSSRERGRQREIAVMVFLFALAVANGWMMVMPTAHPTACFAAVLCTVHALEAANGCSQLKREDSKTQYLETRPSLSAT